MTCRQSSQGPNTAEFNRPRFSELPRDLQLDIREFFGSLRKAYQQADEILFRAGDSDQIDIACQGSKTGRLVENGLLVHRDGLAELEPLLRVYEGCARSYLGEIDGANVIKLHRFSGKVSYLVCPEFETAPHPVIERRVKLSMRSCDLYCVDDTRSEDPPLLLGKDACVPNEHPFRDKFVRLTRQEERRGLLDGLNESVRRSLWTERLATAGFELRGHRLVRRRRESPSS